MSRILGLDLGTNSIGWAIRETELFEREQFYQFFQKDNFEKHKDYPDSKSLNLDNEIVDCGVCIFQKGVGDGKSGEFSLAAERRKNRSKRRLYNAKRYRKWELLKVLVENNMCPLTIEELRLWSIGNWIQINGKWKNLGRAYPINNENLQQWLAFDPAIFGNKGISNSGKPIRKNPYDLRCELIAGKEDNEYLRNLKIGRALYHLVQRRGFKSSRKSGQSAYAKNEDIERLKAENSDFQIAILAKEKLSQGERFRASGVIQRKYFEDEFYAICKMQCIDTNLTDKLYKAIYFVRPLRSQKGLVGNCTLEKGKPRIPISHPKFEEFRALQFINNIKWREQGTKEFVEIPISLKKRILKELFFRKLSTGKNKGNISEDNYFKFEEIIKNYSENGTYEFNYKNQPNVSTCPTIASLMNVFHEDWSDWFIQDENRYGINWDGLSIAYTVKYGNKTGANRILKIDDIWHLLFDYIQTKDNPEALEAFSKEVLSFDENKAKYFASIDIPQGYGSLSYKAISKILPFLQSGFIYSEAVLFANLKSVLGNKFDENQEDAKTIIAAAIKETAQTKEILNIVNGLIQRYFSDAETSHVKGVDNTIKELAWQDTTDRLKQYFGVADWNRKSEAERDTLAQKVFHLYLRFLNGEQTKEEKASSKGSNKPEIDYYKLPRLDETIKAKLKSNFKVSDKALNLLYHPSDIEMYPVSKSELKGTDIKLLESPQPPSKGWKNPMAMRTLHELRHLLNYLLKIGKIDKETKVVVEMARELNTKNYRKAYSDWTKDRDNENKGHQQNILELFGITEPSIDDYNKFRSAVEQIISLELSENKTPIFQQKYNDFIDIFLRTIKIQDNSKDELMSDEYYNYLMYLILNREEFRKMLNYKIPNTNKWQTQLISTSVNFDKKRKELSELLTKYILWKQQKFQCFYTGQQISLSELFSKDYQIEHTIPRSKSFDSELKNLTVCDATYNSQVKNNRFPTECPNYYKDAMCKTVKGYIQCNPIKNRVELFILPKVKELYTRIKNLENIGKGLEDEKKNANIRLRFYLQFELDYWEKKLFTFTVTKEEWNDKWKNSQLVDTQIISKYARAYLKTVFERVDVQKGAMTDIFKKIYQVKGEEQKDRSKHSHHAQDAGILTLIPGSAKREAILERYYRAEENKEQRFHIKPYESFQPFHIIQIEHDIIINHVTHDKTLTATIKNIRKRGEKTGKIAQGDSIRGQLHKETFFGAVKALERNEQGFPIKENGKYKVLKDKSGEDEIWIVSRKPIKDIKIEKDIIVDELLKQHIQKQLQNGVDLTDVLDFNNKPIRHIRVRVKAGVGFLSKDKAMPIKQQTYISKHKHKHEYLVQNEENYLLLLYEGISEKQKIIRHYRILNLFDVAQLKAKNIRDIRQEPIFQTITKGKVLLNLKVILKAGDRVIFFNESKDEITEKNVRSRLYKLYKFNEMGSPFLYFQNHIEARPDNEIEKAESVFDPSKYQARLMLVLDKINCLFEGIDFDVKPDGRVILR